MMKAMDRFEKSFDTNMVEFLEFLREREANTTRFTVSASQLKVVAMGQALKHYSMDGLAQRLGVTQELIEDTITHTDVVVTVDGKPYLMGESTWISVKNRIEIFGRGFDMLETVDKAKTINARLQQLADKQVQVIVVDDKIRAIMSDEYAIVEASDLFSSVEAKLLDRFDGYEMISGYADHTVSRCKLLLPEMAAELNGLYSLPDEYTPGIIIETSDVGYSANKIGPYWKTKGGSFIRMKEYIYMQHKGDTNLDKILEELPNLFLRYQNTLKKFAAMLLVEIDAACVLKVARKAAKQIGLSKKLSKQIVEQIEQTYLMNPGMVTAYDICRELLSAPLLVDDSQKTEIEELVGKALNVNYETLAQEAED